MGAVKWSGILTAIGLMTLGSTILLRPVPADDPPLIEPWQSAAASHGETPTVTPRLASPDQGPTKHEATSGEGDDALQSALVWKGFDASWQRHFAGFQTPHRVSALGSSVEAVSERVDDGQWTADVETRSKFAPGSHGDLAFPETYFSGLFHPDLGVARFDITFDTISRVTDSDPPIARTRLEERIDFDLDRKQLGFGELDEYAVVLRGFDIESHCPVGDDRISSTCEYDGMWVHRMHFAVEDCRREQKSLSCAVRVELDRGWTPTRGALLQPLTENLRLDGALGVTVIGGDAHDFASHTGETLRHERSIKEDPVERSETLVGRRGYSEATVGLSSFGYELLPEHNGAHPGRYMTSIGFGVADANYEPLTGEMGYLWRAGVGAPSTVFDARAVYKMRPVLLQSNGADLLAQQRARSVHCRSGIAFDCRAHGRSETTDTHRTMRLGVPR
ncbi:MAG: hypothetical protein ACOCV2_08120 [Persicimonas sp.]